MLCSKKNIFSRIMTKLRISLVIFLQVINFVFVQNSCIPLRDCPVALKYIQKRRNDPETITILRNAHCGGFRQNSVFCNRIPDFQELPEGCVSLSECPAAIKLKEARKTDADTAKLLNAAACGYNDRKDMVICKNLVPSLKVVAVKRNKADLLPKKTECGLQAPTSKITSGQRADFEDFPWLALLGYKNESGTMTYQCHGTLISKKYVLTAAHCLKYPSAVRQKVGNLTTVILGEYDTSKTEDCLTSGFFDYCTDPIQEILPESVHIHPKFESSEGFFDIALVRLKTEPVFSDFVKPICLPLDPIPLKPLDPLMIGGWGKTENRKPSNFKLKAQISYLKNTACSRFNIDHTQICAGSTTGADTCKGDSGGPLMAIRQSQDHESINFLVGVVSFGGKCGSGAAVYTNVSFFIDWIFETIHE